MVCTLLPQSQKLLLSVHSTLQIALSCGIDILWLAIRFFIWRIAVIMIIRSECKYRIMHYWLLYTLSTSFLIILWLNYFLILTFITSSAYILVTWIHIFVYVLLVDFLSNFCLNQFFFIFITETTLFKLSFF